MYIKVGGYRGAEVELHAVGLDQRARQRHVVHPVHLRGLRLRDEGLGLQHPKSEILTTTNGLGPTPPQGWDS